MSDDTTDPTDDTATDANDTVETTVSSTYKILGEDALANGAGVLGKNTAGSGTPIGVEGAVPNSKAGYGLSTPDDARVEGDVEATSGHTLTVGGTRALRLGPPGTDSNGSTAGGNVIGGWKGNSANGAVGVTIGGGGQKGVDTNDVFDNYGTVGGGVNNQAGDPGSAKGNAASATVGGGSVNAASALGSTVGGGGGNAASDEYSTVGGGLDNDADVPYATVGGGYNNTATSGDYSTVSGGTSNTATAFFATVGGGERNSTSAVAATVGGGERNRASNEWATVAGGQNNTASGFNSTASGGLGNTASAVAATVGGGGGNTAHGDNSTIAGGENNRTGKSGTNKGQNATVAGGQNAVAREDYTFAAGREAYSRAKGSFVWGDSSTDFVESLTEDEVVFQASGGVVMWSNSGNTSGVKLKAGDSSWSSLSTRANKANIDPVDPGEVLAGVEDLEVSTWEYDTRRGVTHMGPMAGDFYDAFGLGDDPERISSVDADGVALAAIQGLAEQVADLEAENGQLRQRNDDLERRLAAIEDHLDIETVSDQALAADD